jgi:hypothetical protein
VVVAETGMGLEVPGGKKRHAGVMGEVPSCLGRSTGAGPHADHIGMRGMWLLVML